MANSLYPGYIRIQYTSAFGIHVMTLPVNTIDVNTPASDSTIDTWEAGTKVWGTMVDELITELVEFVPATTTFNFAELWRIPNLGDDPIYVDTHTIDEVGVAVADGADKASQMTITWRTDDGGISKLVLLDMATGGSFAKVSSLAGQAALQGLHDAWTSMGSGWSGRDNSRPVNFIQAAKTLNEALRREYRMN